MNESNPGVLNMSALRNMTSTVILALSLPLAGIGCVASAPDTDLAEDNAADQEATTAQADVGEHVAATQEACGFGGFGGFGGFPGGLGGCGGFGGFPGGFGAFGGFPGGGGFGGLGCGGFGGFGGLGRFGGLGCGGFGRGRW
jgi:hypothetical protein